jgi:hypothetical protein
VEGTNETIVGVTEVKVRAKADGKSNRKIHPYVQAAKVEDDFSKSQKSFAETFNSMRKHLLDIGEMDKK